MDKLKMYLTSKTVWSAVILGAIHAVAKNNPTLLTPELVATLEGICVAIFGAGVKDSIQKTGPNPV